MELIIEQIQFILLIIIFVGVLVILILKFGIGLYLKYGNADTDKCPKCKGTMIIAKSRLYVLPIRFDETHKQMPEYYFENAVPIENEEQIPTGNHSCYIHTLQCQSCAFKNVNVVDFLKVRDKEILDNEKI